MLLIDATNTNEQTEADVTRPASKCDEGNDLSTTYSYTLVAPDAGNKNCSGTCQSKPFSGVFLLDRKTLSTSMACCIKGKPCRQVFFYQDG